MKNKQLVENELELLYEQEKQLEKALTHIREAIRENINYLNKNKESTNEPT